VSTYGLGAGYTLPSEIENLESGTLKKFEIWHLDFFSKFFSNFFLIFLGAKAALDFTLLVR